MSAVQVQGMMQSVFSAVVLFLKTPILRYGDSKITLLSVFYFLAVLQVAALLLSLFKRGGAVD